MRCGTRDAGEAHTLLRAEGMARPTRAGPPTNRRAFGTPPLACCASSAGRPVKESSSQELGKLGALSHLS